MNNFGIKLDNENLEAVIVYELNSYNSTKPEFLFPVTSIEEEDIIGNMDMLTYNKLLGFQNPVNNILNKHTVSLKRNMKVLDLHEQIVIIMFSKGDDEVDYVTSVYAPYYNEKNNNNIDYIKLNINMHLDSKGNLNPESVIIRDTSGTIGNQKQFNNICIPINTEEEEETLVTVMKKEIKNMNSHYKKQGCKSIQYEELGRYEKEIEESLYNILQTVCNSNNTDCKTTKPKFYNVDDNLVACLTGTRGIHNKKVIVTANAVYTDSEGNVSIKVMPIRKYYNLTQGKIKGDYSHLESFNNFIRIESTTSNIDVDIFNEGAADEVKEEWKQIKNNSGYYIIIRSDTDRFKNVLKYEAKKVNNNYNSKGFKNIPFSKMSKYKNEINNMVVVKYSANNQSLYRQVDIKAHEIKFINVDGNLCVLSEATTKKNKKVAVAAFMAYLTPNDVLEMRTLSFKKYYKIGRDSLKSKYSHLESVNDLRFLL